MSDDLLTPLDVELLEKLTAAVASVADLALALVTMRASAYLVREHAAELAVFTVEFGAHRNTAASLLRQVYERTAEDSALRASIQPLIDRLLQADDVASGRTADVDQLGDASCFVELVSRAEGAGP